MSYNGSGTFQINTSGQPVVAGTVISSTAFNALTADLATGLSTAITKDGQTTTTARIPFAAGINSSSATDSTSTATGSIITSGGVGIAKALYVGTTANVAGAVTLQSTLGVTGVATFSAAPIYSSLTASSAVATDASKALVSVTNTGTGNNVLATSPTLVTPVLGAASATSVTFNAGAVGTPSITTTGDTNTGIFFPAADTIAFSEGGAEAMRIDSSGNVGIGTASPSSLGKFVVLTAQADTTDMAVFQRTGVSTFRIRAPSSALATVGTQFADALAFETNATERMRISSAGDVGIGTSSPAAKLQVAALQTSYSNDLAQLIISGTDTNQRLLLGYNTSTDKAFIQATKVGTAYQDLFVQPNGGSFTVGTTDTTLYNNTSGNGVCYRVNSSFDVATSGDNCVILNRMTSTGQIQEFRYAGAAVGNISTNGVTITFSGAALSDSRWKQNVSPIENALSSIMEVDFVSFEFKDSGNSSAGVTAQQLQAIPSLSKYVNNGLSDEDYKTVDYNALIGFLGKSIQELKALVDTQASTIQSLTARITALEAK